MKKEKIAIYLPTFLNYSETFIYKLVVGIKKYDLVVFCRERKNSQKFPFKKIYAGKDVINKKRFAQILRSENIKLIHAQFGIMGTDIVGVANKLNIPLITHFRGQDAYQLSRDFFIKLSYKKLFKRGQFFLTVSDHMRKHLIKLGCPKEKITTYYGGIDLTQFKFKPRKFVPKEVFKLVMCGRLVEKKGFEIGLKAISEIIKEKKYKILLNVIGDGPLGDDSKKLANKLNITNFVSFKGSLDYKKVNYILNNSDLLIAPYKTAKNGDSEGIPNILKEALAVGLPVVTTNHSGNPELVKNKMTGLVAAENDLKSFTKVLNGALSKYDNFNKIITQGRKIVENKFDIKKQIKTIEKIYKQFVG